MRVRPLENNPEVLTELAYKLNLDRKFAFQDVYSLDDPELLSYVPRPALALIMIFPITESYERRRLENERQSCGVSERSDTEHVIWLKQTIGNACGTMAILHALVNNEQTLELDSEFLKFTHSLKREPMSTRVTMIEASKLILNAHNDVASHGQSAPIDAEADVNLHFVAFVKSNSNNQFYELDGGQPGPIGRCSLDSDEDVLSDKALASVRSFIAMSASEGENLNFSLCVLAPSL